MKHPHYTALISETAKALDEYIAERYGNEPPKPLPRPVDERAMDDAIEFASGPLGDTESLKSCLRAYWDAWMEVLK